MPATENNASWTDDHTNEVIRGIIAATLSSRSTIYAMPTLHDVSNNGGDRINKKVQQILKEVTKAHHCEAILAEEVGKLSRGKRSAKESKTSESPAKKRKVKEEIKDEPESEDE